MRAKVLNLNLCNFNNHKVRPKVHNFYSRTTLILYRYLQAEKKPPHGQAHLVFANAKPNAEKPKELALPHRHPNRIITFYTQFYEISKINSLF